jgi:hypothetical protein
VGDATSGYTVDFAAADAVYGREVWKLTTTPPAAPSAADAALVSADQVRLSWQDNSATETGFWVDRLVGSAVGQTFFVAADTTQFLDAYAGAGGSTVQYRVRAYNAGGPSAFSNLAAPATPSAPTLTGFVVNDGSAQRSMVSTLTLTFDQPVALSAFAVTRRGGGAVNLVTDPSDGRTWALRFAGPDVVGGSLADGIYDLTVNGTVVRSFHRLFSDADGDGVSDNADLFQMRSTYTKKSDDPAYKWYFDFNQDGVVDNADVFQVRSRRSVVFQNY